MGEQARESIIGADSVTAPPMSPALLRAADVIALHDRLLATAGWPGLQPPPPEGELWRWV